jgi:hypothetical protein
MQSKRVVGNDEVARWKVSLIEGKQTGGETGEGRWPADSCYSWQLAGSRDSSAAGRPASEIVFEGRGGRLASGEKDRKDDTIVGCSFW